MSSSCWYLAPVDGSSKAAMFMAGAAASLGHFIHVLRQWLPLRCKLGPTVSLLRVVCFQVHAWGFVQVVNLGARAEAK